MIIALAANPQFLAQLGVLALDVLIWWVVIGIVYRALEWVL